MIVDEVYKKFDGAAAETVTWFTAEVGSLRTGRVTPGAVNDLPVEHYGARTPLQGVASINSLDARTLQISPWDSSAIAAIQKTLTDARLGAQPVVDGKLIRLSFPLMSEEVREGTIKKLHAKAEEARIRLRLARDEALSLITAGKKDGKIAEDDFYDGRAELNKSIDEANGNIERIVKDKEEEIRTV